MRKYIKPSVTAKQLGNALSIYVQLRKGAPHHTEELNDKVTVLGDFDKHGVLLGIEILASGLPPRVTTIGSSSKRIMVVDSA